MIEINRLKLTHRLDHRILIDDLSLTINDNDKIAIIGEEGNGKSTLLKVIHDKSLVSDYIDIEGHVNKLGHKTAYLPQELPNEYKEMSVIEYFMRLDDFFSINPKTLIKITSDFSLDKNIYYSDRKLKTFSGGELIKIEMAYLLLEEADVLLLDEPSNDLDISTLEFLERFINDFNGPIIYISHDETLIQNTANKILHIEQIRRKTTPRHTIYKGDYMSYIDQRNRSFIIQDKNAAKERSEFAKKEARYQKIYERVNHELNTVSRQDAHGGYLLKKKMHAVKSYEKRLDKEKDELTSFHDEEKAIMIYLEDVYIPNSKKVIDIDIDELKVQDRILAKDIHLELYGPKKIAIIAKNGTGKTTLLKYIKDYIAKDLKVSYMPQNYTDMMDLDMKVTDFIKKDPTKDELSKIMTLLGSIKFKDDEMLHRIGDLSGGQKAKLFFIKMIYDQSQVLILDEPTRNFSPLSNPVIRKILKDYKGAIIIVSHDRLLLNEVPDQIYELTSIGLKPIDKV